METSKRRHWQNCYIFQIKNKFKNQFCSSIFFYICFLTFLFCFFFYSAFIFVAMSWKFSRFFSSLFSFSSFSSIFTSYNNNYEHWNISIIADGYFFFVYFVYSLFVRILYNFIQFHFIVQIIFFLIISLLTYAKLCFCCTSNFYRCTSLSIRFR